MCWWRSTQCASEIGLERTPDGRYRQLESRDDEVMRSRCHSRSRTRADATRARTIMRTAASSRFACIARHGAAAGEAPAQAGKPWLVGQVAPLTGPAATVGTRLDRTVKMWVEDVNATGGINGRKVELTTCNDENRPEKAVACARDMIDKGAVMIFGNTLTASLRAIQPLVRQRSDPHDPLAQRRAAGGQLRLPGEPARRAHHRSDRELHERERPEQDRHGRGNRRQRRSRRGERAQGIRARTISN